MAKTKSMPQNINSGVSPFDMLGSTGLTTTRGGRGRVDQERHPALRGRRAAQVYREMHDNNSSVGSAHEITEFVLRRVRWDAKVPKELANDPEAQENAVFLRSVYGDMEQTWSKFLSDAITFIPFGWSLFEKVFKVRRGKARDYTLTSNFNDNRIGLAGLFIRPQETMADWIFDDKGTAVAFVQQAPSATVIIPLSKCLHFTTKSNRNDPEGRSYYRNAVRSWEFLRRFEEEEAVGFNKALQGMAIGYMPHDFFNSRLLQKDPGMQSTLDDAKKTMAGMRRNKYEYLLWPAKKNKDGTDTGWELDQFKTEDGRFQHVNTAILRKQREIHTVIFATQFLLLAQDGAGGSKALGGSQMDFYQAALESILDNIQETVHQQVTREVYDLNGIAEEKRATWEHSPISRKDTEKWVTMLTKLSAAQLLTPDDPLEDHVRDELELPERSLEVSSEEDAEPDVGVLVDDEGNEIDPTDPNAPEGAPEPLAKERMFTPTEPMAEAARGMLAEYIKLPRSKRTLNAVALSQARLIARQAPLSKAIVVQMAAWFAGHKASIKKSAEWKAHGPSWQVHAAMGGDAGRKWVDKARKEK